MLKILIAAIAGLAALNATAAWLLAADWATAAVLTLLPVLVVSAVLAELSIDGIHQKVFRLADAAAREVQQCFEAAIAGGEISAGDLFDRDYRQI